MGQRHSWSLPEVKGVLKWAKSLVSSICPCSMTQGGTQYPKALTRKSVYTA